MLFPRGACVWLVALVVGWSCCCTYGQDVTIIGNGVPTLGQLYRVECDAVIEEPEGEVLIAFEGLGPGGITSPTGLIQESNTTYRATLFVINPTEADSGTYICNAMINGTTAKSGSFIVDFASQLFLRASLNRDAEPATVGVDYELTCSAEFIASSGAVSFVWRDPDSNQIPASIDTRSVIFRDFNSTLEFRPPQEFHAGIYTCVVVFGITNMPIATLLEVNLPDINVNIITNSTPVLDEDYTFMCEIIIGNDIRETLSYSFLHNSGEPTSLTRPFVTIENVSLADMGTYDCLVEIASPYINDNINVTNTEQEQLVIALTIPAPTVVAESDMPNPLLHFASPILTCNVTLDPLVDVAVQLLVEWTGPGTDRVENVTLQASESFYSSTLELSDLVMGEGDGDYICNVSVSSNELKQFIMDSETVSATVSIEVNPLVVSSPPNVGDPSFQGGRLSLQWTQLLTDFIEVYVLTIFTTPLGCEASVDTMELTLPGTDRSFLTEELEEFSNITVLILARNGAGNMTTTITTSTMSAPPDGMPEALNVTSSDSMSLELSWSPVPCLQTNSEITGYRVTYGRTVGGSLNKRQTRLEEVVEDIAGTGPDSRQFRADGLLPRTSYTFDVQAVNRNGNVSPAAGLVTSTDIPQFVGLQHSGVLVPNNGIINIEDIGTDLDSVICFTSLEDCCDSANMELSRWVFPDDTVVSSDMSNVLFEDRQLSVVSLNRGSGSGEVESGLYRCEIPDSQGANQTVFVGLYNLTEGVPELSSLTYDASIGELACISTGGPATNVMWQRNGVDSSTTFPNSQFVSSTVDATYINTLLLNGDPGSVIGNHTCQVANSRGDTQVLAVQLQGLQISGQLSYNASDDVSITCSTDLQFTRISWRDATGAVLFSNNASSQLNLTLPDVTLEMDQAQFFCLIESNFGDQTESVTVVVMGDPEITTTTVVPVDFTTPVTEGGRSSPGQKVGAIIGGVVGGFVFLMIIAVIVLLICCCLGVSRRGKLYIDKKHPAQYEMNVYMPTVAAEDEEEVTFDTRDLATSQTILTESGEEGYRKMDDAVSVEVSPNSIVNSEAMYENTTFRARDREEPIPVSEFVNHVEQLHMGKNFDTEYMLINRSPQSSYDIASIPHNKIRNRFGNIFPYDYNRVVLKTIPSVKGSDYINASYVNGYNKKKMYIAAQGPNPESLSDFWRMIWEFRIPTIAMLTRCYEGGKKKCVQYYPEKLEEPMYPGQNLSVSLSEVTPFANYTVRKMSVRNTAEPDTPPMELVQYHFLGWPDHGVPTNATTLINFIKQVRKAHDYDSDSYLLVHCSAGVGRTGTFITLDSMLERMKVEQTINIFPFVKELRTQRVLMVQTLVQYSFIFDALNEYIVCGETEIPARKLKEKYKKMSDLVPLLLPVDEDEIDGEKVEDGETTGFEQQYLLLNHMTRSEPEAKFGHAKAPYNAVKNRYSGRIPNYFTRVRLRPTAEEGSDYINASFIDGYRSTKAFIATQGPLENTVDDFWKMTYEYRSKCIVMLCDLVENDKESSHQYWPSGTFSPEKYGKVTVTKTADDRYQDYFVRKFEITGVPPKSLSVNQSNLSPSFAVTQFHYLNWRENQIPGSTAPMIEMLNKILKVQSSTGHKSITVMCNNGVGRTGSFITIYSQLEKLKVEGEIDIFQFAKAARIQRAGLIVNHDQYTFCHQVLADFVETCEDFPNSKS